MGDNEASTIDDRCAYLQDAAGKWWMRKRGNTIVVRQGFASVVRATTIIVAFCVFAAAAVFLVVTTGPTGRAGTRLKALLGIIGTTLVAAALSPFQHSVSRLDIARGTLIVGRRRKRVKLDSTLRVVVSAPPSAEPGTELADVMVWASDAGAPHRLAFAPRDVALRIAACVARHAGCEWNNKLPPPCSEMPALCLLGPAPDTHPTERPASVAEVTGFNGAVELRWWAPPHRLAGPVLVTAIAVVSASVVACGWVTMPGSPLDLMGLPILLLALVITACAIALCVLLARAAVQRAVLTDFQLEEGRGMEATTIPREETVEVAVRGWNIHVLASDGTRVVLHAASRETADWLAQRISSWARKPGARQATSGELAQPGR